MDDSDGRTIKKGVWKFTKDTKKRETTKLVAEQRWTLVVNGTRLKTFFCSGVFLDELAVGYARYAGILKRREDIAGIKIDAATRLMQINLADECKSFNSPNRKSAGSSNGLPEGPKSPAGEQGLVMTREQLFSLMEQLNNLSELYKSTHGVHNSALAHPDGIVAFRDDLGRHNTFDMLNGYALLNGIELSDKIIVTTCRLTAQIVDKAARMGVAMIVSRGITTDLALELAEKAGISIVGFFRGFKFLVYSGEERISIA